MQERPRLDRQRQNQRPHVLIVCDEPSLSEFLAEGLPLGGFWTSVIASGLQAIEVFRLRQFDIVVIDAGLTSFSWIELIRRLRGVSSRVPEGDVRTSAPIVIVSDRTLTIDTNELASLGVEKTLVAPLELDVVVRELHATFDQWQDRHPDLPLADFRLGILE
jgi:DNA-binding response OmpR family regulator